jgi:hypothetical protein
VPNAAQSSLALVTHRSSAFIQRALRRILTSRLLPVRHLSFFTYSRQFDDPVGCVPLNESSRKVRKVVVVPAHVGHRILPGAQFCHCSGDERTLCGTRFGPKFGTVDQSAQNFLNSPITEFESPIVTWRTPMIVNDRVFSSLWSASNAGPGVAPGRAISSR